MPLSGRIPGYAWAPKGTGNIPYFVKNGEILKKGKGFLLKNLK